jgi:hypothetical protein
MYVCLYNDKKKNLECKITSFFGKNINLRKDLKMENSDKATTTDSENRKLFISDKLFEIDFKHEAKLIVKNAIPIVIFC